MYGSWRVVFAGPPPHPTDPDIAPLHLDHGHPALGHRDPDPHPDTGKGTHYSLSLTTP